MMNPPLTGESMPNKPLDSPPVGGLKTIDEMHDPESLYRLSVERLSELHAQAERRSLVRQARVTLPANRESTRLWFTLRRLYKTYRGRRK
jgi:hypothetical protein